MPDLPALLRTASLTAFSGTVYRICPSRYAGNLLSLRGSLLHGARYNVRGYFGALYASLSKETARREIARYFTVPPIGGFVEAAVKLRLTRVADLTNAKVLGKAGVTTADLSGPRYIVTQEIGQRAWEAGIEALLVPSAAQPEETNLAVFLDNQHPRWMVELASTADATGYMGRQPPGKLL
jgi:RES domain-containing protein